MSSTRIGPCRTCCERCPCTRRHRLCKFRHSRLALVGLFAFFLLWPLFGLAAIEAAHAADKGDAETMTLTLKTVAGLLVAAIGATWWFAMRESKKNARIRELERRLDRLSGTRDETKEGD
jgi:hypothetical protein